MEKECENIKSGALKMAWYMRGSVSYTDILNMSPSERKAISSIIDDNLETTKKSGLPFF
jgi:predicted RNA-binding protein Jag